uniref:SAP domain-containing protein n=1 Tax=viral metagenome TaxID=1070528 RepID=A0A6C0KSK9_9ZZZZ
MAAPPVFYPKGTLITLKAHETSLINGTVITVAEGAKVKLLNGDFIFKEFNSPVWVTPVLPKGDNTVTRTYSDYNRKISVPMEGPFSIDRKYIIPIGTDGGAKRKHIPLDKCTVAELKAKAAKRGLKVTGLKKAEIIAKLRR